jgi:hypothetical protein
MDDKAARFAAWVEHNSVSETRLGIQMNSLSEIQTGEQMGSAVANSKFVGPNADQALRLDAEVQAARDAGDDQRLQELLVSAPATGCAMVLSLAVQASGFNPLDPATTSNLGGFNNYVSQVLACPVFSIALKDEITPNMSADWGSVVNEIVSLYQGIDDNDLAAIRNGLYSLAQAASSHPGANETETLFVQNTMHYDEQLRVFMYWSSVRMVTNVQKGGKNSPDVVTNNANLTLYRNILVFDAVAWPTYAPIIMHRTDASLESWLNDTTTPQGPIPVNWTNGA